MDTNQTYDLQTLGTLLKETFAGNQESIKKAEEGLRTYGQNANKLIESLFSLTISDIDFGNDTPRVKEAAASYLITFGRFQIHEKTFSNEQREFLVKKMIDILYTENLKMTILKIIKSGIEEFLTTEQCNDLKKEIAEKLVPQLTDTQINKIVPSLAVLRALIGASEKNPDEINQYFEVFAAALHQSGYNLLVGITYSIQQYSTTENKQNTFLSILLLVNFLGDWIEIILKIVESLSTRRAAREQTSYMQNFLRYDNFVPIFTSIMGLNLMVETQIQGSIISNVGHPDFDKLVNSVKKSLLKILNHIITFVINTKGVLNSLDNDYYKSFKTEWILFIRNSVILYCRFIPDLSVSLQEPIMRDLVAEKVRFLSKLATQKEFYNEFILGFRNLIIDACFSLMKCDAIEHANITENPDQFVHNAQDCIQTQNQITPQAQACQLLESLCNNIDGAQTFTVVCLFHLIDYTMMTNNPNDISESQYQTLLEVKNSKIISEYNSTDRIETCLLGLTVIHYLVNKREDLL